MSIHHAIQILERELAYAEVQTALLLEEHEIEALRVVLAAVERAETKRYRIAWRDGRTEELCGFGPGDALGRTGYSIASLEDLADIEVMTR